VVGGIRRSSDVVLVVVLVFAYESPSQVVRAVGRCNGGRDSTHNRLCMEGVRFSAELCL
jgi:hypothetical protein